MGDTSETVTRTQIDAYRRLGGADRLRLAFDISALARELALTRLRSQHPGWSADRLHRELLRFSLLPAPMPVPLE